MQTRKHTATKKDWISALNHDVIQKILSFLDVDALLPLLAVSETFFEAASDHHDFRYECFKDEIPEGVRDAAEVRCDKIWGGRQGKHKTRSRVANCQLELNLRQTVFGKRKRILVFFNNRIEHVGQHAFVRYMERDSRLNEYWGACRVALHLVKDRNRTFNQIENEWRSLLVRFGGVE